MELSGQIIDAGDKTPLQGATVLVVDSIGLPRFIATIADLQGYFYLNNSNIKDTDSLQVSQATHKTVNVPVYQVDEANLTDEVPQIAMVRNVVSLPPVVVTSHPPVTSKSSTTAYIGIGLLFLLLLTSKHNS